MQIDKGLGTPPAAFNAALGSRLFRRWQQSLIDSGWTDVSAVITHVRQQGDEVVRIQLSGTGTDPDGTLHKAITTTLRGDTVDILALLSDGKTLWAVFVDQWRVPVGRKILSNPSGTVEGKSFVSTALDEVRQEINAAGLAVKWPTPINMGALLTGNPDTFSVSPGGCDEGVIHFVTLAHVTADVAEKLHAKTGGLTHEGERTTAHVVPYADWLRYQASDGRRPDEKTITSLLMFMKLQELGQRGKLDVDPFGELGLFADI